MIAAIDIHSEMLIDRSQVRDPYLRLMLTALGREMAKGSPWVIVDKRVVTAYEPLQCLFSQRVHAGAA